MHHVSFCSDSTYTNRTETSNFVMRTRIVSISPKALIHISRLYCPLLNEPRMTARLSRLDKLCKPQLRRLVNAQRHLSQIYRVDPVEVPIESHCLLAFTSKSREPLYPAHRDQSRRAEQHIRVAAGKIRDLHGNSRAVRVGIIPALRRPKWKLSVA